jgi:Fe-S cluster biosynthesis and repair protein YggX
MSEEIKCSRCQKKRPALGICQSCWSEWLAKQNMLINHYGLNLANPETHDFLFDNMRAFFFNENQMADIDTSKEGSIKW